MLTFIISFQKDRLYFCVIFLKQRLKILTIFYLSSQISFFFKLTSDPESMTNPGRLPKNVMNSSTIRATTLPGGGSRLKFTFQNTIKL